MTEAVATDEAADVGQLLAGLEAVGVALWLDDAQIRYRAPKGVMTPDRLELLRSRRAEIITALSGAELRGEVRADPAARYEPFPVTAVQAAYLVGRGGYAYGGVGCHGYGELRFTNVDVARLDAAWATVVRRHDMLRAVVEPDGTQRVLRVVPPHAIRVEDVRGEPGERFAAAVLATRADMDHRVYRPEEWPLFDMRLTRHDHEAILHFSIDFLIADFVSLQIILTELEQCYHDPAGEPPAPAITFRDATLAARTMRSGPRFDRDRAYWWDRLGELPDRPDLAVLDTPGPARFERLQVRLDGDEWASLRAHARTAGLTATVAVLSAYAEVVGRWSRSPRFTLNVTVLNRPPVHPAINGVVGDFTSVELLAVDTTPSGSFQQRAADVQSTLWTDLDHGTCTGIDVIRELRRRDPDRQSLFPVVFTSSIGLGRNHTGRTEAGPGGLGRLVYGISQTPQVWLDCQAMEIGDGLSVNWDVRTGVFPDGLVASMFEAFTDLLRRLATDAAAWQAAVPVPVPAAQRARRPVREPEWDGPALPLHQRVLAQAALDPGRIAVRSGNRVLTYGELARRAAAVARTVNGWNDPGGVVAIEMDKGWEQVVAVLGVLWAGAAYVPIDTTQPVARRDRIIADVGARHLLTQSWLLRTGIEAVPVDTLPVDGKSFTNPVGDDALAYVIYTSGSTGNPKGVMITHRAAWNTVADINRRFGVSAADRVLGLANAGFDLSVYDIFGPLSVGGMLVLAENGRRGDPAHWADLIAAHGVTLWNSVPSQMEMLISYLREDLPGLRLALLSGDWIRVGLPDAMRQRLPGVSVVSLGGATEASIWSIFHPVTTVDPAAPSIPYGRPLSGQTVEVLGPGLVSVPDLVPGELYIGGAGLALGYHGDAQRTAERFLTHPADGRRLYRTGDLGRYLPDGSIEFLGREDNQVKIRGYRVELAEVEAVLDGHPSVRAAAVVTTGTRPDPLRLAAFVEPAARALPPGDPGADLVAVALCAAAELRAQVDDAQMLAFARQLDATALLQMMGALRRCGVFGAGNDAYPAPEILDRARVAPRHQRLVRRWLRVLEENGLLESDPDTGALRANERGSAAHTGAAAIEAAWRRVDELTPDAEQRTELVSYFKTTAGSLPALLRGEADPLTLLFPEGRTEIHEVAYNAMFLSRYVNRLLVAAARDLARQHQGPEPFRVLEVGSGVGGTSVELIPALADFDVEYVFSDVSEFFLNNARKRFSGYPWIDYRIFDMNADYRTQGLAPNSYDLVVCANVLHYAKDADAALGRLRELLRPGSWVLFIEATRDSYQIMTSMEFLFDEGSGEFTDIRRVREQTFLTRTQWLDVIDGACADSVVAMPQGDPICDEMGFHVFGARFKADRVAVQRADLAAHLTAQLPAHMLPSQLQVVDRLPVTGNGKIDRKALRSWLPTGAAARVAVDEPPVGELEQQIGEVWSGLLRVERVGRRQNFFELGGDSLLAAQVAAELRAKLPAATNLLYDNLLRLLLENATVETLAAQIEADQAVADAAPAAEQAAPLVEIGTGDGPAVILVHDETGELAGFRGLLDALGFGVAVAGLRVTDPVAYLDADPTDLVDRIAAEYARALVRAGHTRVQLVGQHFGGIVAAELARQLTEIGVRVDRLVVIASGAPQWDAADEYVAEYLFYRSLGVDPEPLGFPSGDGPPGRTPEWTAALPALRAQPREERLELVRGQVADSDLAGAYAVFRHSSSALGFALLPYAGDLTLVLPAPDDPRWPVPAGDPRAFWEDVCLGEVSVVDADLLPGLLATPTQEERG